MSNPQFATTEGSNDLPFYELDAFPDDADGIEEADSSSGSSKVRGKAAAEGLARRQLEERREAQRLRRLLADYAWDDRDI